MSGVSMSTAVRRYSHLVKVAVGNACSAATWIGGHRCCGGGAVARQGPHNSTVKSKEKKPAARNDGHSCRGGGAEAWQEPQSSSVESKAKKRPMVKHGRVSWIDESKGLS